MFEAIRDAIWLSIAVNINYPFLEVSDFFKKLDNDLETGLTDINDLNDQLRESYFYFLKHKSVLLDD